MQPDFTAETLKQEWHHVFAFQCYTMKPLLDLKTKPTIVCQIE